MGVVSSGRCSVGGRCSGASRSSPGCEGFRDRRVKNDDKDATLLADLLRMGSLPESWIAPRSLRQLRELVRYRHSCPSSAPG